MHLRLVPPLALALVLALMHRTAYAECRVCTPAQSQWVSAHPLLRVQGDGASPPWEFLDAQGQPAGLVPDYLALVAARTGLKIQWLAPQPRSRLEAQLLANKADLLVAYGVPLTQPSGTLPVNRSWLQDQPVQVSRVVPMLDSTQPASRSVAQFYVAGGYKLPANAVINQSPGFEAALADVASGQASASTLPLLIAGYLIRERGLVQLGMQPLAGAPVADLRWRVPANAPLMQALLEQAWDSLSPAQHQQVRNHWIYAPALAAPSAASPPLPWRWLLGFAGLALLAGLAVWAWLVISKRRRPGSEPLADDHMRMGPGMLFCAETDAEGKLIVVYASRSSQQLFSVDPAVINPPMEVYLRTINPDDHADVRARLASALNGDGTQEATYRVHSKEGLRWVRTTIHVMRTAQGRVRLLGLTQDLSREKAAEHDKERAELLLNDLSSHLPGVLFQFELSLSGTISLGFLSAGGPLLAGVDRTALLQDPALIFTTIHEQDRNRVKAAIMESAGSLKPYQVEYRTRLAGGQYAWVRGQGRPKKLGDGSVMFTGYTQNIEGERAAKDATVAAQEFIQELTEPIPGYLFQLRQDAGVVERRFTYISSGIALLGVTREQALQDARLFYQAVLEADRPLVQKALEQSAATLTPYRVEYRVRLKSGVLTWMRSQAVPKALPNGAIVWNGFSLTIGEQRLHEMDARRLEGRLAALSKAIPGVIFERTQLLDGEVIYPYVSESAGDALGISPDAWMRDAHTFESLMSGADQHQLNKCCKEVLRTGVAATVDCRINPHDQEPRWLRISLRRNPQGDADTLCQGYVSDVTQERNASTRVAILERRFHDLTAHSPAMLFQLRRNRNGKYEFPFVSPSVQTLTGISVVQAMSDADRLLDRINPEYRRELGLKLASVQYSNQALHFEFDLTPLEGGVKRVRASFSPPREQEGIKLWSGVWQELNPSDSPVAAPTSVVSGNQRMQAEFLANVSHEIRTPLNAILGLGQILQSTHLEPRQRSYLKKMLLAGNELTNTLTDILDFSQVEAGRLSLELAPFELNQIIGDIANQYGPKAAQKNLELLIDMPITLTNHLVGDAARLRQILANLVGNAIKFSEHGVVLVKLSQQRDESSQLQLSCAVSDEGLGMSEAQLRTLFHPFAQGDGSSTRKHGGTGLGLAIVQNLVELMHGTITVDSAPGAGSTFKFTARLGLLDTPAAAPLQVAPGTRVLYCGGSPLARDLALCRLQEAGFEADGISGLSQLLSHIAQHPHAPYRLLLLDESLAVLPEAALILKTSPQTADMALLLISTPSDIVEEDPPADAVPSLMRWQAPQALVSAAINALKLEEPAQVASPLGETHEDIQYTAGLRVLVVTDDDIAVSMLREWLEDFQCTVRSATDGNKAQDMLSFTAFDLVLMDIDLPARSGFDAVRALRAEPRLAALPTVAMCSTDDANERAQCRAAGFDQTLLKPVARNELSKCLRRFFASPALELDNEPLLDIPAALARLNGSESLYQRLLKRFIDEHSHLPEALAEAVANQDPNTAIRLAHTLKAMAGSLGANALAERAGLLELALHTPQDYTAALSQLSNCHQAALLQMQAHLGQQAPREVLALDTQRFQQLAALLADHDAEAKDLFAVLEPQLIPLKLPSTLRLRQTIEAYDFETASIMLQDVLNQATLQRPKEQP